MNTATGTARDAQHRLEPVARAGYLVNGILHVLIGYLAVRIAVGSGGNTADQSGALAQVAGSPAGAALLWAGVAALAALTLWQLTSAVLALRVPDKGAKEAAKGIGKAVVYGVLAFTAATFASGGQSSSEQKSNDITATLMRSTAGTVLVAAIGLAVLGVGVFHVVKGVTDRFRKDLGSVPPGRADQTATWTGRVGYAAKGVALGVVGGLFCTAALQSDPQEAGGLDSALRTLARAPFGVTLLIVVGLGFAAYGVYCAVRARWGSL